MVEFLKEKEKNTIEKTIKSTMHITQEISILGRAAGCNSIYTKLFYHISLLTGLTKVNRALFPMTSAVS